MVDLLRLQRLLRRLTGDLAMLEAEARADGDRRDDPMWLPGVKYLFITAIEAGVDIAHHVCATEGWGPPADNGDAIRLLGTHGMLTNDLATEIRKAVGFRNVLVHDYAEVDDQIVTDRLADLSDLRTFAKQVATFIADHTPNP